MILTSSRQQREPQRSRARRWVRPAAPQAILLKVLCVVALATSPDLGTCGELPPFRVAFSTSMFAEVNENDAMAAVKVWAQVLAKERDLPIAVESSVLNGLEAIAHAVDSQLADAVGLSTDEYWKLNQGAKFAHLFLSVKDGRVDEEYLLLVHRNSRLERIQDFGGRSLAISTSPRASLAPAWLETVLLQNGLGRTERFLGRVTPVGKLSQVILPVFFRKMDACLITRNGFEIMTELNPQIGRQLKVIASSPRVVPVVFAFRSGSSLPYMEKLLAQVTSAHTTVAGQQVLTIFQCDKLEEHPASSLQSAFDLLTTHRRLLAAINQVGSAPPGLSTNAIGNTRTP